MSRNKQLPLWVLILVMLGGANGQMQLANGVKRRYGGNRQSEAQRPLWLSSQIASHVHQKPKYLDISLDLLGRHSSHFPLSLAINDNQKVPTELSSNKLRGIHSYRPFQPARPHIHYAAQDNERYTSLMQAADAAASSSYVAARKPYPYQVQQPLYVSYPTYGVHYQQQQPAHYNPVLKHHQYYYSNNHLTSASSSSSHYSLNNPLGLSSCCNGNQWNPLYEAPVTSSSTQIPLLSASEIPQVLFDPSPTASTSKQQMSLYLPVKMYNVVAESNLVTHVIPSTDRPSPTAPTALYIPVPKENSTIIESHDHNSNVSAIVQDDSSLKPDMPFDGAAVTSTQWPPALEAATSKPHDETSTTIATAVTIKDTPTTTTTTIKTRPTTAKDTKITTTTAKPNTKPKEQLSTRPPELADDTPSMPSAEQPSRPVSPVDDPGFESSPIDDPGFESSPIDDPSFGGVPGDLPAFEDAPAEAPAGPGEESPLPGLFSEFLNQVADMIEEFQPTTELPLADDVQGLSDGAAADDFADAPGAGQDSLLSGSSADGNFESPGDGPPGEGGQDGGDFGVDGQQMDDFGNGPGANNNFAQGEPGNFPLSNNPVPTSVQDGTMGRPTSVGEQSAQSLSNTVAVTADNAGQTSGADMRPVSDVAYVTGVNKVPPMSNPTPPAAAAQMSDASGQYPSNSANYDPVPISSQPQIHPPYTDYVDPEIYNSLPSIRLPQIGATLSNNNAVGLNNRPEGHDMFPNRMQNSNPMYGNEFPHSNDDGEPHFEATTVFEHYAIPEEYPPRMDDVRPYLPIDSNTEFSNQIATNNTSIDYDAHLNGTNVEERPIWPVSNHLGNHDLHGIEPTTFPLAESASGHGTSMTSTTPIPYLTSSNSQHYTGEDSTTNAPFNNPNVKVDVIPPAYQEGNHLGLDGISSMGATEDVLHEQTAEILHSPPPLALVTPTTAPDTTIREYVSVDKTITDWTNHVENSRPNDSESEPASIEYSEGDVPEAEGIPADILPEVQANINIDLLKTAHLAKG